MDSELDLDLNVDNYAIDEIREMLHLDEYKLDELDFYVVESSYDVIYEKLKKEYDGNKEDQDKLLHFYHELKTKMFLYIKQHNQKKQIAPREYKENDTNNAYCIRNDSLNKNDIPILADTNQFKEYNAHIQQYVFNQIKTLFKTNKTTRSTLLVINSKFRKDVSSISTDFVISLPYTFNNVVSMSFKSIEFTNTMYTINKRSCYFIVNDQRIEIEVGNYTHAELIDRINTMTEQYDLHVDHDLYKNKIKFYMRNNDDNTDVGGGTGGNNGGTCHTEDNTSNTHGDNNTNDDGISTQPINIYFDNDEPFYTSLGYILGFRKKTYRIDEYQREIIGEAVLDSEGTRNIYVEIDDYQNASTTANMVVLTDRNYMSQNVIAKIQNYASTYHITYESNGDNIDKLRVYNGPVKLNKFHIRLLDDNGEVVDNNMMDYIITLEIHMNI